MDKYEKLYNEALEQAKKELATCGSMDCDAARQIFRFFPQLRESEDERIRKRLINLIRELANTKLPILTSGYFVDGQDKDYIAWLEKQKESLHISETCKENSDSFTDACKDVIVAIEKYLDWLTGYPDYAPKGKYSLRDMLYCLSILEKQKEEEGYEAIPVESTLEYKLGFKAGKESEKQKEQKPAEWSDEDKAMIERLIRHTQKEFDELCNDRYGHQEIISDLKEDCRERMRWLEKLKSLKPQPKKEWSEEDEKIVNNIVSVLGQYIDYKAVSGTGSGYATPRYSKEMDWLRSLRPSWKHSKDEERLINTSISFLKDFADKGYENAVECIDWLKSKLNGNSGK